MRAVVYDAPRQFSIRDVPIPQPGPGEVRVKVIQTGVCGTDLHLHEGGFMATFPLTPGHETVGTIDEMGAAVEGLTLGEQVTINPNSSCTVCDFCRAGRPILCNALNGMGTTLPGAFAEYVVAPARQIFSVDGMPIDTAVFVEPTSCVAHGVDVIRPLFGHSALVFGAGPTGLLLAQLIASTGATHLTVAASTAFKLETARSLGIDSTHLIDRCDYAASISDLRKASGGAGYDLVVDATGSQPIIDACVGLTRNGGTVLIYGVADEDYRLSISPYEIFRRELTIKGSFAEINSFGPAIAALRTGRARTDGIISHRFDLADYGQALETLRSDPTAHKVVITTT